MRKAMIVTALAGGCLLAGGKAYAQNAGPDFLPNPERSFFDPDTDMQLLRKDLRLQRRQIVGANMVLSDAQEKAFWPIYTKYESDLARIYNKKVELIQQFSRSDDTEIYFNGREAVEDSIVQLRLSYVPIFRKVLTAKQTALFFRIDWRLCQMVDLQLERTPLTRPFIQP